MSAIYGRGLAGLWKRGWNEVPEIMGSSCLAVFGVVLGYSVLFKYDGQDHIYRKHKLTYVVVRPDDPRAPKKE